MKQMETANLASICAINSNLVRQSNVGMDIAVGGKMINVSILPSLITKYKLALNQLMVYFQNYKIPCYHIRRKKYSKILSSKFSSKLIPISQMAQKFYHSPSYSHVYWSSC